MNSPCAQNQVGSYLQAQGRLVCEGPLLDQVDLEHPRTVEHASIDANQYMVVFSRANYDQLSDVEAAISPKLRAG